MQGENLPSIDSEGEQIKIESEEYKYSENQYRLTWRSHSVKGKTITRALARLIKDIKGD